MTRRLHGMILRMLPGPILGWLGTLMFLLLMQFLIRYLPDIAGKGLPFPVIVELILYNLAYMLVLAVPMSILIGTMMVFGKIAESRAYVVIKSAGISPIQLIWPSLVVGLLLTLGMTYFNNIVLPEANFRARNLWQDIRKKRPGFELRAGTFYDGLKQYSILVQGISEDTETLRDVLIYDYTSEDRSQAVIKAREGQLRASEKRPEMMLTLMDGELHRLVSNPSTELAERYERLAFDRYQMKLDLSDFTFERSAENEGYRSDRTMRTGDMVRLVDSLEAGVAASRARLVLQGLNVMKGPTFTTDRRAVLPTAEFDSLGYLPDRLALTGLRPSMVDPAFGAAISHARTMRAAIEDTHRSMQWEEQRADRFRVEIHKKFSIAIACLIFVLIGAPLGLSIRHGGLGRVGMLASGIFLFYWVTLVQGEKLADRGFLDPWVGMWTANLVMLLVGICLMVYQTMDLRATKRLHHRLSRFRFRA